MDEVSTPEVMECMFINAIAPFVLNSRLKPLMTTPAGCDRPDRYIINVSAMEGKFYRYKMPNHPHTNMAKAALNMMTRTSSEDLAKKSRIYMNSVDTGWINDENPLEKASKIAKTNLFQTPIDEIDAAARILDQIFVGVAMDHANDKSGKEDKHKKKKRKNAKEYGKFFKDYRETEW
jgi:NAD(P)-dependent dehydrogenase (short-subunit alcohol dehydrogenase family)